MTRPGVCFGGPSPEHDISILTGLQAVHALADAGRNPVALYWDLTGLAYTGPGQRSAAICMDKLAFSGATEAAGLPTLPLWLLTPELPGDDAAADLDGVPLIVKPRFGGSSIGIEIVDDLATAQALARSSPLLRDGAVVQRYLSDITDLNISVRTWPELRLSAVERPLRTDSTIYTYAEKYLTGGGGMATAPRELPAVLPAAIESSLRAAAVEVSHLVMARSVMRIDFLWDGGDDPSGLWVNEINPIPGSLSWYFWSHEGDSLIELLEDLIAEALEGPTRRFVTQGADGTALRSVGSIAAKLA